MAPSTKRRFFKYTHDALLAAIGEVHGGKSIRKAASDCQIPFGTLYNKVKGKHPLGRRMGPPSVLTKEEEELLLRWIDAQAKKGFPLKRRVLCETVEDIVKKDMRVTPFTNSKPGRKWYSSFLKRHPTLKERFPDSINKARANVTEDNLRSWFMELHTYLESENALDILEDPSRIFNADESGFQTCPKTGKVLGPISFDNFYEVKSGSDKEAITVLGTFCANGEVSPGMIVYPLQRITKEIVENVADDWGVGRSKKGWMQGSTYFEYLANVFLPYLQKTERQMPVLLLVDGHKSHLTYEVAKFCAENKIFHFSLYPNATHILQPADVAIFRPLKVKWREIVYDWKRKSGNKVVSKAVFGALINAAFQQGATPASVRNGFRKCGIYPYNPDAVDYTKCMANESRTINVMSPSDIFTPKTAVETMLLIESLFPKNRAEEFRNTVGDWEGPTEAQELYAFWRKIRLFLKLGPSSISESEPSGSARAVLDCTREFSPGTTEAVTAPGTAEAVTAPGTAEAGTAPGTTEAVNEPGTTEVVTARGTAEAGTAPGTTEAVTDDFPMLMDTLYDTPSPVIEADVVDLLPTPTIVTPSHKSKVRVQASVSPAFADVILWPHDSPEKGKKRTAKRLPSAITSATWIRSFEEKLKAQNEKESKKKDRIKKREDQLEQKRKEGSQKTKRVRRKIVVESDSSSDSSAEVSSGESAWVESSENEKGSSSWKPVEKFVGEFVVTKYDEAYFPGETIKISDDGATVSSMVKCGRLWKWPERRDILKYPWASVVGHIEQPKKVSKTRNVYSVPELEFTWN